MAAININGIKAHQLGGYVVGQAVLMSLKKSHFKFYFSHQRDLFSHIKFTQMRNNISNLINPTLIYLLYSIHARIFLNNLQCIT